MERERQIRYEGRDREKISRRSFLKLGLAGFSGVALLFLPGCLGDGNDSRRRRRRRRT